MIVIILQLESHSEHQKYQLSANEQRNLCQNTPEAQKMES